MKRIRRAAKMALLGIGILLVVLFVIMLVNVMRFDSRQIQVTSAPRISLDSMQAARRLAKALTFRTLSETAPTASHGDAFVAFRSYLEQSFPLTHRKLKREVIANYSLLYKWEGTRPEQPPILLMSHLDVVPVEPRTEDNWTHDPFAGGIAGGYIWGRGAMDVKDGVMGILEAVEWLLKRGFAPSCDIYLAFGHDEELGGLQGNAKIAEILKARDIRFDFILDEGGPILDGVLRGVSQPVAYVGVAEKGKATIELSAEGPGGHSSIPPPQTAVGIVAAALTKLQANPLPLRLEGPTNLLLDYLGPEMPLSRRLIMANRWIFAPWVAEKLAETQSGNALVRTTCAATVFHGGIKPNVLPTHAQAFVNIRLLPGDTVKDAFDHVVRTIDDERVTVGLFGENRNPSGVSDADSKSFKDLHRTIRQVFLDVLVAPGLLTGGTDSRHYAELSDNIFRFIPARYTEEDLKRFHGIDERISVEAYADIIRFFVLLIQNTTSLDAER